MLYIVPSFLSGNITLLKPSSFCYALGLEIEEIFNENSVEKAVISLLLRSKEIPDFLQKIDINTMVFQGSHSSGRSVHDSLNLGLDVHQKWDLDNHTLGLVLNQPSDSGAENVDKKADLILKASFNNSG